MVQKQSIMLVRCCVGMVCPWHAGSNTIEEYLKVFPDSNMQRLANLFCLDGDVEDDADGEKDGTGDEDKQILEDSSTNDPKSKEDSITEDIDFSVLDRMKKFNPTKYGEDFTFAFPKFTCGDCSSGILPTIGDKEYFTQLIQTERWWDAESIRLRQSCPCHRCKLMNENTMDNTEWVTHQDKLILINKSSSKEDPDVLWEMGRDVFILQTDGVSCGPIVTAKIFNALGIAGFDNGIGLDGMMGVRRDVVKTLLQLLNKNIDNMDVIDPTSEKWCLLCNEELTKRQGSRIMKCCSKEVHGTCIANLLQLIPLPVLSAKPTSLQMRS
jgi:hypothetical protein